MTPASTYFGSNAFGNVTISGAPSQIYQPATNLSAAVARRVSGTWIIGATAIGGAYPAARVAIPAPGRVAIAGFSERARLILTGKGLMVSLLDSGVNQTYVDYAGVGFSVTFNRAGAPYEYLEITSDATYVGHNVTNYLVVNVQVPRPRILVFGNLFPKGRNIQINSGNAANNPDFVLSSINPGLSLQIAQATRFYIGSAATRIESITSTTGGTVPTIRFVSNLPTVTVYVRQLLVGTTQPHFFSGDNANIRVIVGDVPFAASGNQYGSDAAEGIRHSFGFSGAGQLSNTLPLTNLTKELFEQYVAADTHYSSLTVSNNAAIHVPTGRVFFVNASHQFPDPRYWVVLDGFIPAHNATGPNLHPVICGVGIACLKFEVVFKDNEFYTNGTYHDRGDLGEQKCFPYKTFSTNHSVDALIDTIQCVGYESLELKKNPVTSPNPLPYSYLTTGQSIRSFWHEYLFQGVHSVTLEGQALSPGLSVNVDQATLLKNADLTLGNSTSWIVYVDSTSYTLGHVGTLTVKCQLQILSIEQTGVAWPANNLEFTVSQTHLNWSNFKYEGLLRLTLLYADYVKLPAQFNKALHLTISSIATALNASFINFTATGADFVSVAGEHLKINRTAAGFLTLSGWSQRSAVRLIKSAPLVGTYSFNFISAPQNPETRLLLEGNWATRDTNKLSVSAERLAIDTANAKVFGMNLTAQRELCLAPKVSPEPYIGNITFTGVVTVGVSNAPFTFIDSYMNTQSIFEHLVLNTSQILHQCWNNVYERDPVNVSCQPIIVRTLSLQPGGTYPFNANIKADRVVIRGGGARQVTTAEFPPKKVTFGIVRGSASNPVFWYNDLDAASPVPVKPENGEIEASISRGENGSEIIARSITHYSEFEFDSSQSHHLVCSSKFDCPAWLSAFSASAAQVRTWPDGSTSTFHLSCSKHNIDVGTAPTLRYIPGDRWEGGNLTDWTCLDYKEVIAGGSAGSPHADFAASKKKGLSKGAIAGIAIAVVVVVLVIVILLVYLWKHPPGWLLLLKRKLGCGRPHPQ
jgi:hypothetical protein